MKVLKEGLGHMSLFVCPSCKDGELHMIDDRGWQHDYYKCNKCESVYDLGEFFKKTGDPWGLK